MLRVPVLVQWPIIPTKLQKDNQRNRSDQLETTMDCPTLPWMIDFHSTQDGKVLNNQFDAAFAEDYNEHLCKLKIDSQVPKKRLSGIICTFGPSCNDVGTLGKMMEAGMSIIRIKTSHYNTNQCIDLFQLIKEAIDNYSLKIKRVYSLAIAIDVKGPEIRTGVFKNRDVNEIELVEGNTTSLTTDPDYEEFVTEDMIYVDYQKMDEVIQPGNQILIDTTENGQIRLSAIEIVGSIIKCLIETTGRIANRASVSLEGVAIDLPVFSEEDVEAIQFCASEKVAIVLISCVQNADCIAEARKILGKGGRNIMVVAKIENSVGVYNIDEIVKVSDAVLVSRAALAKELPAEKVFMVQKMIIGKCNKAGIPVICAPQMLDSMTGNMKPTNAEIADVANAITDGADCFMLSRETAIGLYPVQTVAMLSTICKEAEACTYHKHVFAALTKTLTPIEPLYAIAIAAVEASLKCNAAAILVTTVTGRSAKVLSRFRPRCPIVAVTRHAPVSRFLNMWRGVDPIQYIMKPQSDWSKDVDSRIQFGLTYGKVSGYIKTGDALIVITGSRMGAGFTNTMKIVYASEFDC